MIKKKQPYQPNEGDTPEQILDWAFNLTKQISRDIKSHAAKEALAIRKAKGLPMGRPAGHSKLDNQIEDIEKYLKLNVTVSSISKIIGCDRGHLAKWIKRNKSKLNLEEKTS